MKPNKLPGRVALFVTVLALGLLIPGLGGGLTQADMMLPPCGPVDAAERQRSVDDDALTLSALVAEDIDRLQVDEGPRPNRNAPPPPGLTSAPKPPGADLRPPDAALLNAEPVRAAREFRESLTDKQKAEVQAILTKHRDRLQEARARLPELAAEGRGNRPAQDDRESTLNQVSIEMRSVGDQIDQEIDRIITPKQRALLQKANPKRLRGEASATDGARVAVAPGC